jgi:hypothetical protein
MTPSGTDLAGLAALAGAERLAVLGGFHPESADAAPPGTGTLLLLGPEGPGFWDHVTAAPEFADGRPDPLDRWSRRVIGRMACALGGKAVFPFAGPPWAPFQRWALRSGQCWESPVRLLVHAQAGLWVSFRGALALRARLDLPAPTTRPCDGCADQPCRTACPVGALTPEGYAVPACHEYLDTGADCLAQGCAVRRACPVSVAHGRDPAQSAYHMRRFHPGTEAT